MLAADFIKTFPLSEADSRAALRFIASFIHTDISQIEQRHAILRRRPHVMSPTNRPTVGDSSAEWTMRQHRARRGKLTHGGRSKKVATEKNEKKRKQRSDKAASLQPKLRKFGKGGAGRAFTREQTFGIPGKPDFKALTRAFRALPVDERAHLRQKGRQGTAAGKRGGTPFGLSSRAIGRKAAKRLTKSQIGRMAAGEGQALAARGVDALAALALTQSDISDLSAVARVARGHRNLEHAISAAKQQANADAICRFQDGIGAAWKEHMVEKMQGEGVQCFDLVPWPESGMAVCHMVPRSADQARKAVSYAIKTSRTSNLQQALNMDWDKRVEPVTGAPTGGDFAIGDMAAEPRICDGPCREHGICVCSPAGQVLKRMWARFMQAFKLSVKRGSEGRSAMREGRLVLKLHWQEVAGADGPAVGGGDPAAVPLEEGDEYWHIAWVCLAPYRPSFQVLRWCAINGDRRMELRATWRFLPVVQALEGLDRALKWQLQFWRLLEPMSPVACIDPSSVHVELFSDSVVFWDPARKWRAAKAKADGKGAGKGAPAVAAPDEADGGGDGDGDAAGYVDDAVGDGDGPIGEGGGPEPVAAIAAAMPDAVSDDEEDEPLEDIMEALIAALVAVGDAEAVPDEGAGEVPLGRPGSSGDAAMPDLAAAAAVPPPAPVPAIAPGFVAPPSGKVKDVIKFHGGELAYFHKDKRFEANARIRSMAAVF